jgi:hypothetical protein
MSHKLTFTLKQHTPLIHFQPDQSGATLRATELKPKLDRFLLQKFPDLPHREHPNGDVSLDYKVKIFFDGKNKIAYPKPFAKEDDEYVAPYFADGVSIEHDGNVEVHFFTFDSQVRKAIDREFPLFLSVTNFGTRGSKGFGSYHLTSTTLQEFEASLEESLYGVYKLNKPGKDPRGTMKIIDSFYKELKSGVNLPRPRNPVYKKSLLFEYMCDNKNGYGWEKRWLKKRFPQIVHGTHEPVDCEPPKEYRYIRALLGLAEHNEYRPKGGKKQVRIKHAEKNKDRRIERFRSPITFKVFDNTIYLLIDGSYETMLDKEFIFSLEGQSDKLKTPDRFDLESFLDFVAEKKKSIKRLKGVA